MAAELTLLRSRLLAPADAAAVRDAEADAERLRRRLLDRAEAGRVADWLETREQLGHAVWGRGRAESGVSMRAGRNGDIAALLWACLKAIQVSDDRAEQFRVPEPPFWSAADAAKRIREVLAIAGSVRELEAFLPEIDARAPDAPLRCRRCVDNVPGGT